MSTDKYVDEKENCSSLKDYVDFSLDGASGGDKGGDICLFQGSRYHENIFKVFHHLTT